MTNSNSTIPLTHPQRFPLLGAIMFAAGGVLVASAAVDSAVLLRGHPSEHLWLSVGFFVALGFMIAAMGLVLLRAKGGAAVDSGRGNLVLGSLSSREIVTVPLREIKSMRVQPRSIGAEPDNEMVYSSEVLTLDGACIVLLESHEREEIVEFTRNAAQIAQTEVAWSSQRIPEPQTSTGAAGLQTDGGQLTISSRAGFRWSLAGTLGVSGVCLSFIGIVMLCNVALSPLMGFLAGPPLMLLGLVLLAVVVGKSLGCETIQVGPTQISRRLRLGPVEFGTWSVEVGHISPPYARLRPLGSKGHAIEVVGATGSQFAMVGANSYGNNVSSATILAHIAAINTTIGTTQEKFTMNEP